MKITTIAVLSLAMLLSAGALSIAARNLVMNVEAAAPGPQTATPPAQTTINCTIVVQSGLHAPHNSALRRPELV